MNEKKLNRQEIISKFDAVFFTASLIAICIWKEIIYK
jgi:hypothetical protein